MLAAHVTGRSDEFPLRGANRRPWRDCDVKLSDDEEYATRFLDALKIV